MSQQPERLYVDANVFLSYIAGDREPDRYPVAKAFFKGLLGSKKLAIFSFLTAMEILDVLRKIRAENFDTLFAMPNDDERISYVIDGAREIYAQIIGEMLSTPEIRFMDSLKLDITQLLRNGLEILSDMKGRVNFYDTCNRCNSKREDNRKFISVLKSPETADMMHALIAKELKCNTLITFDKGFLDLANDSRIRPLQILVLKPIR